MVAQVTASTLRWVLEFTFQSGAHFFGGMLVLVVLLIFCYNMWQVFLKTIAIVSTTHAAAKNPRESADTEAATEQKLAGARADAA